MSDIRSILESSEKLAIKIDNQLHLAIGHKSEVDEIKAMKAKLIKKARVAMLKGERIELNGVTEWIVDAEIHPEVWHKDGNRSLHNRYHWYESNGKATKKLEKQIWKNACL